MAKRQVPLSVNSSYAVRIMDTSIHIHSQAQLRKPLPTGTSTAYSTVIATPLPLPHLGITCEHGSIIRLHFLPASIALKAVDRDSPDAALIQRLVDTLSDYFNDPKMASNLPIAAVGTAFQQRAWQAISSISVGETRSYGWLARELKTSPRAVGGACRANPLPILVPCHRVIAADGGNGGFLGHTAKQGMSAKVKEWLLLHERN